MFSQASVSSDLRGENPIWLTGGTPILPDWGYPLPRSGQGVPQIGWDTPIQTWNGGTPHPDLGREYPPVQTWKGVTPPPPHPDLGRGYPIYPGQVPGGGYPQLEQHSVYFLRGRRYASCVHAGRLSCFRCKKKLDEGRSEMLIKVLGSWGLQIIVLPQIIVFPQKQF